MQIAMAATVGVPTTVAGRLECQHDMPLSTLAGYLTAVGERPRIVVTVDGHDGSWTWPRSSGGRPGSRSYPFPIVVLLP